MAKIKRAKIQNVKIFPMRKFSDLRYEFQNIPRVNQWRIFYQSLCSECVFFSKSEKDESVLPSSWRGREQFRLFSQLLCTYISCAHYTMLVHIAELPRQPLPKSPNTGRRCSHERSEAHSNSIVNSPCVHVWSTKRKLIFVGPLKQWKFFSTKIFCMKIFLHENFQIYGRVLTRVLHLQCSDCYTCTIHKIHTSMIMYCTDVL